MYQSHRLQPNTRRAWVRSAVPKPFTPNYFYAKMASFWEISIPAPLQPPPSLPIPIGALRPTCNSRHAIMND